MRKTRKFIKNGLLINKYCRENKRFDAFLLFRFHSKRRFRFGIRFLSKRFGLILNKPSLISFQALCKDRPDQLWSVLAKIVKLQDECVAIVGHGVDIALDCPNLSTYSGSDIYEWILRFEAKAIEHLFVVKISKWKSDLLKGQPIKNEAIVKMGESFLELPLRIQNQIAEHYTFFKPFLADTSEKKI